MAHPACPPAAPPPLNTPNWKTHRVLVLEGQLEAAAAAVPPPVRCARRIFFQPVAFALLA